MRSTFTVLMVWNGKEARKDEHPAGPFRFVRYGLAADATDGPTVLELELDAEGDAGRALDPEAGEKFAADVLSVTVPRSLSEQQRLQVEEAEHEILGGLAAAVDLEIAMEQTRDAYMLSVARLLYGDPAWTWPPEGAERDGALEAVANAAYEGKVKTPEGEIVETDQRLYRRWGLLQERERRAYFLAHWRVMVKPSHRSWADLAKLDLGDKLTRIQILVEAGRVAAGVIPKT